MPANKKINVAIIFGGKSAEHEVSILSAKSIVGAIDKSKYNITLLGIDKIGKWSSVSEAELLTDKFSLKNGKNNNRIQKVSRGGDYQFLQIDKNDKKKIDVVFPILHGPFGEDGTIQGLLKMLNVAFVGPGVLGSAVNMDKDVSKRLLKEAGVPIVKFLTYYYNHKKDISFGKIKSTLGLPFFVKPANLGSSVGISKVQKEKEFKKAIESAFSYDNKIIIEKAIQGKEIECSVLGNEEPIASVLGEIIPTHSFYSYEAKYSDENGAKMAIPANISEEIAKKIQKLAVDSFKILCCEGMGRVDFFLTKDNKVFVNEINTIPGFTPISMYPKLWKQSGVFYPELIDKLIQLAIDRHKLENKLKFSV